MPCRAKPIIVRFSPEDPSRQAKGWLYPDEDATLLAADSVPLMWRVFYRFLHREGPRISEAVRLRWTDFDLDRRAITMSISSTPHQASLQARTNHLETMSQRSQR